MTQTKLVDKQQPSIQNIQPIDHCTNLSQLEINRLFIGPKFSKFQLMDIKMQTIFCKHEKAQFFIHKLDSWNERLLQQENLTNIRTQFILMSFVYTSIKRISLMKESQIDKQLQLLYSWFHNKSKDTLIFNKVSMPPDRSKNEYYNVTKSFKTNPALQIDQYRRPIYFLCQKDNQQVGRTHKLPSRQKFNGNFLTELQQDKNKILLRVDKQQQKICQQISKIQRTIRDEELRRYLQKKQIQQQQWNFKLRKERLIAEQAKNYLGGNFQTALRSIKTSQGTRQNKNIYIIQSIKRMRIQTSFGKKRSLNKINSVNKTKDNTLQLVEVGNFGLLSNPFETNNKNKKKLKIRSKNKI